MKYEISDEVREKTDKCEKNFFCLSGEGNGFCHIIDRTGDTFFVKYKKDKNCPYNLSFGDSFICNCPTRAEIYRIYST